MYILRLRVVIILSALILSILLIGGCGKDSPTEPQGNSPTIVSFTANPSTIPAGGDSVKLSWEVSGATSLSISSGIGTVTPTDSGAITIFVSAASVFTLTATNSTGSVTADASVSAAQSIMVNGFVKDIDGEPISSVTVIVKGKTPTTTGANGAFSVSNVITPYEIRLILSTQQTAIVYQGLTRSDPSLLYFNSTTPNKSATITGSVPVAPGKTTLVFFVSGIKSWWTTADLVTGAYSINANWKGPEISYNGKLQVLRWTFNPNGSPSEYDAYGSKDLTISDGGLFSGKNFIATDFSDPSEQSISGSITRPTSSYAIRSKHLYLNFGNAYVSLWDEGGVGLTDIFSYTVPTITGATFEVDVDATISAIPNDRLSYYQKKGITGGTSGINIVLANAPQLNLPVHNGTGIDTTTQFLWAQGGGTGVNFVYIGPTFGSGPTYYLITAESSTTIPNLGPQGLGLPSNVAYVWWITRFFPVSTIDDAASDSFIPLINGNGGETGRGVSEMFNFTTHP